MHQMLSANCLGEILEKEKTYRFIALDKLEKLDEKIIVSELPFCLRVVLESNLRRCKNEQELRAVINLFAHWQQSSKQGLSMSIYATRVLLQDYTGIPVLVDLCALRQVAIDKDLDPEQILID
jgi:aconitate hydratase